MTVGKSLNLFWDSGATINLVSSSAVKRLGLRGTPISYDLSVAGGSLSRQKAFLHMIELVDCRGRVHTVTAFEIEDH